MAALVGSLATESPEARLDVALERYDYEAGEVVRGVVHIHVKKATEFKSLDVELHCSGLTRVTYKVGLLKQAFKSRDAHGFLMPVQTQHALYFVGGHVVPAGSYNYPFDFQLPSNAPPSVDVCKQGTKFRVEYDATATLRRWSRRALMRVFHFKVARPAPTEAVAGAAGSRRSEHRRSRVVATVATDRGAYRSGDIMRCMFHLENGSKANIDSVEVFVEETHTVKACEFKKVNVYRTAVTSLPCHVAPGKAHTGNVELPFALTAPDVTTNELAVSHRVCVELTYNKKSIKKTLMPGPDVASYGPMPRLPDEADALGQQALLARPVKMLEKPSFAAKHPAHPLHAKNRLVPR